MKIIWGRITLGNPLPKVEGAEEQGKDGVFVDSFGTAWKLEDGKVVREPERDTFAAQGTGAPGSTGENRPLNWKTGEKLEFVFTTGNTEECTPGDNMDAPDPEFPVFTPGGGFHGFPTVEDQGGNDLRESPQEVPVDPQEAPKGTPQGNTHAGSTSAPQGTVKQESAEPAEIANQGYSPTPSVGVQETLENTPPLVETGGGGEKKTLLEKILGIF